MFLVLRNIFWLLYVCLFFFFKQKTAYEMRISDWSSDVCSSDLRIDGFGGSSGGTARVRRGRDRCRRRRTARRDRSQGTRSARRGGDQVAVRQGPDRKSVV